MDTVIEALRATLEREIQTVRHKAYHDGYNVCERKWRAHMAAVSQTLATAPTRVEVQVRAAEPRREEANDMLDFDAEAIGDGRA